MLKSPRQVYAAAQRDLPRPTIGDFFAGIGVALVLIPQSIAYAKIAGLPPEVGLFASAFPPILASMIASSPYLQTGATAMVSLLTLGVLSGRADELSSAYIALAGLLALLVGVGRLLFGTLRMGWLVYLMTEPVLLGFTSAAAILITASQLPTALAASPPEGKTLYKAGWTLVHPGEWSGAAALLALATIIMMLGGRKLSRLFPGALLAVIVGIAYHRIFTYGHPLVGDDPLPHGLPTLNLGLPWSQTPTLLIGAVVIALVGFAEPASIARTFQRNDERWSANREFISQGIANVASGVTGGFPVGGSFSRSSLNKLTGAATRWSGGITGVAVLCFLPFSRLLEDLPKAVLGGIVISAVFSLLKPRELISQWEHGPTDAGLAWITFAATLITAPHIEYGIILGVALAVISRLARREPLRP